MLISVRVLPCFQFHFALGCSLSNSVHSRRTKLWVLSNGVRNRVRCPEHQGAWGKIDPGCTLNECWVCSLEFPVSAGCLLLTWPHLIRKFLLLIICGGLHNFSLCPPYKCVKCHRDRPVLLAPFSGASSQSMLRAQLPVKWQEWLWVLCFLPACEIFSSKLALTPVMLVVCVWELSFECGRFTCVHLIQIIDSCVTKDGFLNYSGLQFFICKQLYHILPLSTNVFSFPAYLHPLR